MADGAASVTYSSSSEDPTGHAGICVAWCAFVISDGDLTSAAVTRTVTVTPVNDVPVLADVEARAWRTRRTTRRRS